MSESWSDNDRSEKFRVYLALTVNKTLRDDEIGFYADIYNRYPEHTVQKSIDIYMDSQKGSKYIKTPSPKVLKGLCEEIEKNRVLEQMGGGSCELCKNTGERLLLWAGNNRNTKANWRTKENLEDGMRIVKERGEWQYLKYSVCPCSCAAGYKVFMKGELSKDKKVRRAGSFDAIKKLEAGGYLVKHKDETGLLKAGG